MEGQLWSSNGNQHCSKRENTRDTPQMSHHTTQLSTHATRKHKHSRSIRARGRIHRKQHSVACITSQGKIKKEQGDTRNWETKAGEGRSEGKRKRRGEEKRGEERRGEERRGEERRGTRGASRHTPHVLETWRVRKSVPNTNCKSARKSPQPK